MAVERSISLERMVRAVEKVKERLVCASTALERAGIPYAIAGGNAVAAWVSTVDEAAVRNTRGVDVLVNRSDRAAIKSVLEREGFLYRHVAGIDVFLDSPESSARDAVHLIFAGEQVRAGELAPNPELRSADTSSGFRVIPLRDLVTIKLTAFRDKDRMHLRDMIEVGLIDQAWVSELPEELGKEAASVARRSVRLRLAWVRVAFNVAKDP